MNALDTFATVAEYMPEGRAAAMRAATDDVRELIAADIEYDAAQMFFHTSGLAPPDGADERLKAARIRRAAALAKVQS